jgi:hypothetical protein
LNARDHNLQYTCKEKENFPQKKRYSDYQHNADKCQRSRSKKPVNGVSDVWKLDKLPYAEHIVWLKDNMHCFTNIIRDSMNVLTPSHGKFVNRTEKTNVREQCKVFGIHEHLHIRSGVRNNPAKWTISLQNIETIHGLMSNAPLGCRKPFTNGGGQYSHDKLLFATVYARHVLPGFGDETVTKNILKLFDIMTYLTSHVIPLTKVDPLLKVIYETLADHDGLLPPTESTYAFHELVHVGQQIMECGPPVLTNMYKYERFNKYLKNIIKNRRSPISSLIKNYLIAEASTMNLGTNFNELQRIVEIYRFVDKGISGNIVAGLKGLCQLQYNESSRTFTFHETDMMEEDPSPENQLPFPNASLMRFVQQNLIDSHVVVSEE